MKKSLNEQIIKLNVKERLKIVKKNKLEKYNLVEQQLKDTGFHKTGTFSFKDPTLNITHNKDVYVLSNSGLILTLYYISNKKNIKVPMQLTVCGQYKDGSFTRISCSGYKNDLMSEFISSRIPMLAKNCNPIWTTIDSHFNLLDDYDYLFISRHIPDYNKFAKYYINNFSFYNNVYTQGHSYNTIIDQVQCAELLGDPANIRTNLYAVTSDKIAQIMGIELTNIKINKSKSLYTGLILSIDKCKNLPNSVEEKFNDKDLSRLCTALKNPKEELSF